MEKRLKEEYIKEKVPLISVIVPVYNIAEYLPQCIDSICEQEYPNLEIILVDDGSADSSPLICDQYARKDNRIHVIHKDNGGLVSARKAGLYYAKGEYISYVDGDDWIEHKMYRKLWEMGLTDDIIAFAGYEEYGQGESYGVKKNTIREGRYSCETDRNWLYSHMMVNENFYENGILTYLWSKLIRRKILLECQNAVPDTISYAEDTACVYPCLLKAKTILVANTLLYHYRVRSDSMVRTEVKMEKMESLFQTLGKVFLMHPLKENLMKQLKYSMWHAMLLKNYTGIKHTMTLFPFKKVKPGMRVSVYGAGIWGKVIWGFCQKSDEIKPAGWFDQRYKLYASQGFYVQPTEDISDCIFDVIVIAIANIRLAQQIKTELLQKGISKEQIDCISIEALEEMELPVYIKEILLW